MGVVKAAFKKSVSELIPSGLCSEKTEVAAAAAAAAASAAAAIYGCSCGLSRCGVSIAIPSQLFSCLPLSVTETSLCVVMAMSYAEDYFCSWPSHDDRTSYELRTYESPGEFASYLPVVCRPSVRSTRCVRESVSTFQPWKMILIIQFIVVVCLCNPDHRRRSSVNFRGARHFCPKNMY